MTDTGATGHDGPFAAPVVIGGGKVLPEWIDYNGHMNVAYYTLAFDQALDVLLEEHLGLGETYVTATKSGPYALQSNYHYAAELMEGEAFSVAIQLLDFDQKRLHLFCELQRDGAEMAACLETLIMNVDHQTRRSTPYPDWARKRLETMLASHQQIDRSPHVAAPLGIRRR